ncbi:MAG TPA: VWA domain-containing protein [Verrucomicrobiae bacterium]|jgi:Ca-activated chloride channel family protein|nr:VWA domain-containing protein [Verrucomicrobiae bacterium]
MKYWFIVVLTAALSLELVAQNSSQQLPNAPSSSKYPPPPSTPPPANTTTQTGAAQSGTTPSDPAPSGTSSGSQASKPTPPAGNNSAGAADAPAPDDTLTVIRKRVDEVNVVFTVTDKRDHFVKDLTQSDFRVLDDNKPAQSIQSFSRQTNLPLRVGLLIDASNSVRDRFKFEQEAAIEFLNQIIRPNFDKAFIIGFDTTPEVTQDFTDSPEALSHGVRMLRPGGGTAMYDAIYFACRDKLMGVDKGQIATRRAIILLSDGEDNQSRVSREEAVEMAQRAEVIIYTISTNTSGLKLRGDKVLEHFAEETGGKAFFPFKIEDVANAFTEISDELRSQYAISYKPADFLADGKYRKIEILADNKKYHVRARKGYYAPKQ